MAARGALGQHAGGLSPVGGQHRLALGDPVEEGADQRAHRRRGRRQGEPDIGALAHPLQQSGLVQQPEMARQAGLRLAQDFAEIHHAEAAAGRPAPTANSRSRVGSAQAAERGKEFVHEKGVA